MGNSPFKFFGRKVKSFEDATLRDWESGLVEYDEEDNGITPYEALKWNLLEPNIFGGQVIYSEGDYTWCISIDIREYHCSREDLVRYIKNFDLSEVRVSVIQTQFGELIVRSTCEYSLSPYGDGYEF